MEEFKDINGNRIQLSFKDRFFDEEAGHVLVICQLDGRWLLTQHSERGLEFPGGKVEPGETIEQAARREVYEETGAILKKLNWIADYRVLDKDTGEAFVKAVFSGIADRVVQKKTYYETKGPFVFQGNLTEARHGPNFSFIMKDEVIEKCLKQLESIKSGK
ncbi:nucleoside triphosphatase YtkD [Bacillus sp. FJAT-27225]|uniref:RNA deprotection pyrophosphohydrolase n=1 Tax=Bacillus sp. FJAT-27225 TaxID=1743144 RepID=UPI00080C3110|nr:nucleoside triphosphatase YtkD [Bacillus sp. FJAT-27225]OCA91459.1 nucleoside triphosphatase YtkD [Bacillus sp. FJAT-27225]